jgi:hypothetical protein
MSFRPRYAILIDGAFVIRKLESRPDRTVKFDLPLPETIHRHVDQTA